MYQIVIPKTIHQLIGIFYRLGIWSDGTTFGDQFRKFLYFIYFVCFVISMALGGYTTHDKDERIFLTVSSIISVVQAYRMWIIIWRKNGFLLLVHRIGRYSTDHRKELIRINNKLNHLMTFVRYYLLVIVIASFSGVVLYPITNENHLILNIAFPFDRNNSNIAFFMASAFIGGATFCFIVCVILIKLTWYLMLSISFEYKILGNQLRYMGTSIRPNIPHLKVSLASQQQLFYKDLILANQTYDKINRYIGSIVSAPI